MRRRESNPRNAATRRSPALGDERLPNRCRSPSVRAVNRWNLLRVQLLGDRLKGHPLPEHRVDLYPPPVVTFVAEPMPESNVVGCEVSSVHLESRIVVGRQLPIGTRRSRLEVPTAPEAVALGHLATHIDDLAISGKLPEDSANAQGLKLLEWSLVHKGQTRPRTCQKLLWRRWPPHSSSRGRGESSPRNCLAIAALFPVAALFR